MKKAAVAIVMLVTILAAILCGCTQKEEQKEISQMTYVAFGDSITYGYKPGGSGRMETPYPAEVKNILGLNLAYNYGTNGATLAKTYDHCHKTAEILAFNRPADIVSVLLGTNDYLLGLTLGDISCTDATTVYGALHLIAEKLTADYKKSFVFFMTPLPFQGDTPCAAGFTINDVGRAVKEVAAQYGIDVLDLYTLGGFDGSSMVAYDTLHPNQDYVRKTMAPLIANFIKNHFEKQK